MQAPAEKPAVVALVLAMRPEKPPAVHAPCVSSCLTAAANHLAVVVKTVLGSHFGGLVNSPPSLESILLVGLNRMFTGGYDLDFDPWPFCRCPPVVWIGTLGPEMGSDGTPTREAESWIPTRGWFGFGRCSIAFARIARIAVATHGQLRWRKMTIRRFERACWRLDCGLLRSAKSKGV